MTCEDTDTAVIDVDEILGPGVEIVEREAPTLVSIPSRTEWDLIQEQATVLSKAQGFIPSQYFGQPNKIMAAALYGRAVGLDVTASLRLIHVIEGKPTFSAEAMVALVRLHGHSITGGVNTDKAWVKGTRKDNGDVFECEFDMADARNAGLLELRNGKQTPWHKFPKSMLWARAVSQLCRVLFPDVFVGMAYTPEEIDPNMAHFDVNGRYIDVDSRETEKGVSTDPPQAASPETVAKIRTALASARAAVGELRTAAAVAAWEQWRIDNKWAEAFNGGMTLDLAEAANVELDRLLAGQAASPAQAEGEGGTRNRDSTSPSRPEPGPDDWRKGDGTDLCRCKVEIGAPAEDHGPKCWIRLAVEGFSDEPFVNDKGDTVA